MYSGVIELQTGRALHRLDAVLESVVVFRVASRAVAEVVVPLGFAEACFFPRRPVVSGVAEQGAENAKAHAGVCACGGHRSLYSSIQ